MGVLRLFLVWPETIEKSGRGQSEIAVGREYSNARLVHAPDYYAHFKEPQTMRAPWPIIIVLLLVSGQLSAGDDAETIRELRAQSNAAIARHDAAAVGSFLSEDFVITISTGAIERSRDEHIQSFAAHFEEFPDVVYVRTPSSIQLSDAYPIAIESGEWTGTRTIERGRYENGGRYTAAWRKTDGGWKIYSELYVGLYCDGPGCEE
jgi:ketosteroid isomerase-like protein